MQLLLFGCSQLGIGFGNVAQGLNLSPLCSRCIAQSTIRDVVAGMHIWRQGGQVMLASCHFIACPIDQSMVDVNCNVTGTISVERDIVPQIIDT